MMKGTALKLFVLLIKKTGTYKLQRVLHMQKQRNSD